MLQSDWLGHSTLSAIILFLFLFIFIIIVVIVIIIIIITLHYRDITLHRHPHRILHYYYLTNRFHVAVYLSFNRSQRTSKCGKNKKVAHEAIAECVTDVLTTF